jgi:hypothetical protein
LQDSQPKTEPQELYVYAYLPWSGDSFFPDRQSSLSNVVDLQLSLFTTQMPELMQQIRDVGAAAMAAELRIELARDWPVASEALDSLRDAIRRQSKQGLGERFLYTGAVDPLSSLLYYEMSREAIGQPEGVALKDITGQFGRQSTPFRKHIRKAHMPFPCPCCGCEGLAYDLVLDSKKLTAGSFSCSHCGHEAQMSGPNALTCQCQTCSGKREAALMAVSKSAEALVQAAIDRLEDAASRIVEKEEQEQFQYRHSARLGRDSWEAYALLRHAGRTELEAIGTLFGGSYLVEANGFDYYSGQRDVGITPPVLETGILDGIFEAGNREVPSVEVRKRFLRARLLDWINAGVADSRFQVALRFDDLDSVIFTLKEGAALEVAAVAYVLTVQSYSSRQSAIVAPVRWKLTEYADVIEQLAELAERNDTYPQHIYARHEHFDPLRHGKPLVPLTFPEWPTHGEHAPAEQNREESPLEAPGVENPETEAAVRLLKSLGYVVMPPPGKKRH